MAHIAPNAIRFVGAVDQVGGPAEVQSKGTERVIRPRWHNCGKLGLFSTDRSGRIPGRVRVLSHDPGRAEGRPLPDSTEAERVGLDPTGTWRGGVSNIESTRNVGKHIPLLDHIR